MKFINRIKNLLPESLVALVVMAAIWGCVHPLYQGFDISIHGLGWLLAMVSIIVSAVALSLLGDYIHSIYEFNGYTYMGSPAGEFIKEWAKWQVYTVAIVVPSLIAPSLVSTTSIGLTILGTCFLGIAWGTGAACAEYFGWPSRSR